MRSKVRYLLVLLVVGMIASLTPAWAITDGLLGATWRHSLLKPPENAPVNVVSPGGHARIIVHLWDGENIVGFPGVALGSVTWDIIMVSKAATAEMTKNLQSCYKELESAMTKKTPADQNKAATAAVSKLDAAYRKIASALADDIQSAAEKAYKGSVKTLSDRTFAKYSVAASLEIDGIKLPPAGGFLSFMTSSGRDGKKQHKEALAQVPGFGWVPPQASATNVVVCIPWMICNHLYSFVNNDDQPMAFIKLPVDLEETKFIELCAKVRAYLAEEGARFDPAVAAADTQMRQTWCAAKSIGAQFDKAAADKEIAICGQVVALKTKAAAEINKIIQSVLNTSPKCRLSPNLRSFCLGAEEVSPGYDKAWTTSVFRVERAATPEPSLKLWNQQLNGLSELISGLPRQIGDVTSKSKDAVEKLRQFVSVLDAQSGALSWKDITTGDATKASFEACSAAAVEESNSVASAAEPLQQSIESIEGLLVEIERKAGANKPVMAQVNGTRALLEFLQKARIGLIRLRMTCEEQSMMYTLAQKLNNADVRKAYLHNASLAIAAATDDQVAKLPSIDVNALNSAIASLRENKATATLLEGLSASTRP